MLQLLQDIDENSDSLNVVLTDYVEGRGLNLYRQSIEPQDNQMSILFLAEKIMQDVGIIPDHAFPEESKDQIDSFAKNYSINDLVLILTYLSLGVVKGLVLNKPSKVRRSKAKKPKRENTIEEIEANEELRTQVKEKMANLDIIRTNYDLMLKKVLKDIEMFYKRLTSNPQYMTTLTSARVVVFARWLEGSSKRKPRKKNTGKVVYDSDEELEKRMKRIAARQRGELLTSDDEEGEGDGEEDAGNEDVDW